MVKEFNHIGINVRDLQKTLAFYSKHFGAKIMRGLYIPASHTIAAYVQIGSQMVEFLSPLAPDGNTAYGIAHIAYIVDDIEEAARILIEKGHPFHVMPKRAGSGGGKIAFLKDPNGANVELIERLESYSEEGWEPTMPQFFPTVFRPELISTSMTWRCPCCRTIILRSANLIWSI